MFFPWVGFFEQIELADIFVNYSDIQHPTGSSFTNRVQIKTADGVKWMTVPLCRRGREVIANTQIDYSRNWRAKHLALLRHGYAKAPFKDDMLSLVASCYEKDHDTINSLNVDATNALCRYFSIRAEMHESTGIAAGVDASGRLVGIVKHFGGDRYVTGWGAKNYLDCELFEKSGLSVDFMDYQKSPYPQLHGEFTPFVSILDLVANAGKEGRMYISPRVVSWRGFASSS